MARKVKSKARESVGPKRQGKRNDANDLERYVTSLATGGTSTVYRVRSYIFRQGGKCDALFYIQKGQLQLTVVSKQGKERVVGILGAGAFIGESCLAGHPVYMASARALIECTIVRIEAEVMTKAIYADPEMSRLLMGFLLHRNTQIESDLVDQLFNSSEKRLARTLLLLANFGKEGGPQPITTPISQETLAEIIGTTRPRVSHFMNKFRTLGFISYNGHLQVHTALLSVVLRD